MGWMAAAGALWATALVLCGGIAAAAHPKHPKDAKKEKPAKQPVERCAVKRTEITNPMTAQTFTVNDRHLRFCCPDCLETFKQAPEKYLKGIDDPVSGFHFRATAQSPRLVHEGVLYIFMNAANMAKFQNHPDVWIRILRHEPAQ